MNKLREKPFLAKENLEHGKYYKGICRNAEEARWNADEQKFYHWRFKFGHRFVETIKHPEDEKHYDVFYPHELLLTPTKEVPFHD